MTLNDVSTKGLAEVLNDCNLLSMKYHTNDDGVIQAIELHYRPNDVVSNASTKRSW